MSVSSPSFEAAFSQSEPTTSRGCRLSGGDNFEAIRSNSRAQALPGAYALRAVRAGRSVRNLWLAQLPETPAPLGVRSARGSRWGTHSPRGTSSSLQCLLYMSSRSDEYRHKAAEAKNRAAQTSSLSIKNAFEEVARDWLLLAEQTEWIERRRSSLRDEDTSN